MKFIENNDLHLDRIDTRLSNIIEQQHEAKIARKLKEEFPELEDYLAEKYSRRNELSSDLPESLRDLHSKLYKDTCRCCGGHLNYNRLVYEGTFNQNVSICEKCRDLLILRGWLEEMYSDLVIDVEGLILDSMH